MKIETVKEARGRNVFFLLFLVVMTAIFAVPLSSLFRFSYGDDTFSYIPLIPLVSAYLIFQRRKVIFSGVTGTVVPGAVLVLIGIILYAVGSLGGSSWNSADRHSIMAVSAVACFVGGIGLRFGSGALTAALFPLAFLLFMAPVPSALLDRVVRFLQYGSAEVSFAFLKLTGVPVFREGYVFHVPGLSVEVAKQCSGIRSSLSLFLVSLLAGHLFLETGWRKVILCIMVIPITIVKNGIRIVTLTLLGAYVDRAFLAGFLHQSGGIPFFLAAMVLLSGVLLLLRRSESRKDAGTV
jgi:exosortase